MRALGFEDKWIQLIISCVSLVSYSILINGQPGEAFCPNLDLRQGDPLSPCLFLMCAESLNSLINNAERRREIQGLSIVRGGTSINHIFFADDSILFCRASKEEWCGIQGILDTYEKALERSVNKQKSSLFFSSNTPSSIK